MLLKSNILEFLVCPTCRGQIKVTIRKKIKTEIIEGKLTCKKCNESFQISKGIPRFVKDKTKNFIKTEDAFSAKWRLHHDNHQAQDWINFQQKWFFERYGWKSQKKFNEFLKDKQFILDAGTGVGNSAKMLSANPNSQIFALDASESIDFAFKKYGKFLTYISYKLILECFPLTKNFLILFIQIKFYIIQKTLELLSNI